MSCRCWTCRKRSLALIAPRLTRAARQAAELAAWRREQQSALHRVERLIAHRELQLSRAGHSRSGRYIAERTRKLREAEAIRDRITARIERAA